MTYAHIEYRYAAAFADNLKANPTFRPWILAQTKFVLYADSAKLLHDQMLKKRSKGTKNYWNSHFHTRCACFGCRGELESRETDVFAVFEAGEGYRFAIHVEVKRPGDLFKDKDQALAYRVRAKCWATPGNTPKRVLSHADATTVLLFSAAQHTEFAAEIEHFDVPITFEAMKERFPNAVL